MKKSILVFLLTWLMIPTSSTLHATIIKHPRKCRVHVVIAPPLPPPARVVVCKPQKVWIEGHWRYTKRGHARWVPGHWAVR